jgi:hypothetical protein
MSSQIYSNLPLASPGSNATVNAYDVYFSNPIELDAGTLSAIEGFFESRGFDPVSAESTAVVIIKQAKQDGYNPMKVLDTMQGLDNAQISTLVSEILNYNRLKTSFLGYTETITAQEEIARNIVA